MRKIESVKHWLVQKENFQTDNLLLDDWTLIIVVSGSFQCTIRGKTEEVFPGNIFLLPPNVPVERSVTQKLVMHFFRFSLTTERSAPGLPCGKLIFENTARVEQTVQMLANIPKLPDDWQNAYFRHLLQELLLQYDYEHFFRKDRRSAATDETVTQIIEYLELHSAERISMAEVAKQFYLSPSGLIKKFRRATGTLPQKYLTDLRIRHAKRLLEDTAYSISEIADKTGFESVYYFSKVFHKQTEMTPSAYRKSFLI